MFEEEILLLIKENRHREAIQKYVDNEKYDKAEEFCITKDKSLGLLTTLLTIYFQYYEENEKEYEKLKGELKGKDIAKQEQYRLKSKTYSTKALELMRNHSAKNQLDPLTVLNLIPEEWELITESYNLISLLSSVFDH